VDSTILSRRASESDGRGRAAVAGDLQGSVDPDEREYLPVVRGIEADLNLGGVFTFAFGASGFDERRD
jgi:hypothetical protein